MKLGELKWSHVKGEGAADVNKEFGELHYVTKLDALGDWIGDLERLYNDILEQSRKDFAEKRASRGKEPPA